MITPICTQLNPTEDISSQTQQPVTSLPESSDDLHLGQQDEHCRTENNTQENTVNDKDIKLKEEIKTIWIRNYKKYIEMEITEREFMTKAKPLPQQKHIQLMDEILAEEIPKIEEQHGVDIWTLNVIYYVSAVTILEKEGRLREIRRKKTAKHTPGWQIKLEARIEAIRRTYPTPTYY